MLRFLLLRTGVVAVFDGGSNIDIRLAVPGDGGPPDSVLPVLVVAVITAPEGG